jgi:hypothetical protein
MAASLAGTLGTRQGRRASRGRITVTLTRRPSLSRAGEAPVAARDKRGSPSSARQRRDTAGTWVPHATREWPAGARHRGASPHVSGNSCHHPGRAGQKASAQ